MRRKILMHDAGPTCEIMSKRRKGYPSATQVKLGEQIVHGGKLLEEKLGRNDLCPCGSGRRFQEVLLEPRLLSTASIGTTTFREE